MGNGRARTCAQLTYGAVIGNWVSIRKKYEEAVGGLNPFGYAMQCSNVLIFVIYGVLFIMSMFCDN